MGFRCEKLKKMFSLKVRFLKFRNFFMGTLASVSLSMSFSGLMGVFHSSYGYNDSISGFILEERSAMLVSKQSSREQVILSLGTPSFVSIPKINNDSRDVYYVSQDKKSILPFAFLKKNIVGRTVLKISFGKHDRVSNITRYSISDARKFRINPATTPIPITKEDGIFKRFTGSIDGKGSALKMIKNAGNARS